MKKLRILQVSFDTEIKPYELSAFRGAVARKVGLEHHWFHNHDNENGGTINRYPLIQYKINTQNGQLRPMLLCLEHGIEEAHHFFSQSDWSLNIKGTLHNMRIANLHVNQYTLNTWDKSFSYRLHKWLPFNSDNFKEYQKMESLADRFNFLEQRLATNIKSFAEGVDWQLTGDPLSIKITDLAKTEWIDYKQIKSLAFTIDFKTNVSLPDFIGVGRGASKGLGVVRRVNLQ